MEPRFEGYMIESHMFIGRSLNRSCSKMDSCKDLDGIDPSLVQNGRQYFVLNGTHYSENSDDLELYLIFSLPSSGDLFETAEEHFNGMLNTQVEVEIYHNFLQLVKVRDLKKSLKRRLHNRGATVSIREMVCNASFFDSLHQLSHPQVFYVGTAS